MTIFRGTTCRDSTVFITGATGLIGYTAVCALLRYDQLHDAGIKVVALVRDVGRAEAKFSRQIADGCDITFIRGSVEYLPEIVGKIDYIIHGACRLPASISLTTRWRR